MNRACGNSCGYAIRITIGASACVDDFLLLLQSMNLTLAHTLLSPLLLFYISNRLSSDHSSNITYHCEMFMAVVLFCFLLGEIFVFLSQPTKIQRVP